MKNLRRHNPRFIKSDDRGFIMPTVIILIVVMSSVAYATLLQANNSLNVSYKQAYIGMAREASKAAIDYAQEQFDNASCGNYSGTAETPLTGSSNNRFKITMQADIQSTSGDGFEKKVIGTGRIYLPKTSASALYVFDIRSEIVRTYAVCKTPDNFAPLAWYDASNVNSLKGTTTTTPTPPVTTFGNVSDSTRDTLEERADNGTQTLASWQSNDFEMHDCDAGEFSNSICNSNTSKYLNDGMVFSNVNIPKDANISSASIKLSCTTPSGASGTLNQRIYGIYKSATNPHPDLFTQSGSNQLKTPLTTANLHTTSRSDVTNNNCPPGNQTVYDVTAIVQEEVNNTNWNPTLPANGGRLGFVFSRTSGSGSRHLLKSSNQLSISYSTVSVSPVTNTQPLFEWDDLSGNGNNAKSTIGTAPTRQDNQINGKTVVRFNNGALAAALTTALSGKREFTAFAVLKPAFGTSSASGRILSGMSASSNDDVTAGSSIIPIRRTGSSNTSFSSNYDGLINEVQLGCAGACISSSPYLMASSFTIDTNDTITAGLRGNGGSQNAGASNIDPGTPPPKYTFGIDQLYLGGNRTSSTPSVGGNFFNGDYAELVVYDKALTCHQIEDLEEYFRAKWNIAASPWVSNCPDIPIPTL